MNLQQDNKETKRDLVIAFLVQHPKAPLLLRAARKRAQETGGRWRAVYIETTNPDTAYNAPHEQVLQLLTRARQMGGETEHIEAFNMLAAAQDYLERESPFIDSVLIGNTGRARGLFKWLKSPDWVKLVELVGRYVKVETMPLTGQFEIAWYVNFYHRLREIQPIHIAYALLAMVVPVLLAGFMQSAMPPAFFRINEQNIDNLFLITAAIVAGRYGLIPGLMASIAGFFLNNYYFTVPYHQIKLQSATDFLSMALFLSSSALIAFFTSKMRDYAQKIQKRGLHTEILFALYRLTSEAFTRQQAIELLQKNLEHILQAEVAFFLPVALQPDRLETAAPASLKLEDADQKALTICWNEMKSTGAAAPYNPGTPWRFEPIISPNGEVGVLGVKVKNTKSLDAWFGRLLTAAADQTAVVLAHIELERSMENTRLSQEREKLRVTLLSSVSHDLKTPLAGIIGALSACQTLGSRLKPEQQKELIDGSLEEARRLDSFISNILDMTRLETGNIQFRKEWLGIREITEAIAKRMVHRIGKRKLSVQYPASEIEICADSVMTSQVLQNLLDNACKYTTAGTHIDITWALDRTTGVTCSVRDYGKGIPQEKLDHVFDKYTRLQKQDTQTPGTGLGLAIAKAVMEAQGGWVKAANHPEGGAVFTFYLPQWRPVMPMELKEKNYAAVG